MPELPEVEITRRGIEPHLTGKTITAVTIRNPKLRWPIADNLPQILTGLTIRAVTRRAKYLLMDCTMGSLIFHLGMSGSLRILNTQHDQSSKCPLKHDHFDLILNDQTLLRFRDPRRFGAVLWYAGNVVQHPLLLQLGPEPLTTDFSAQYLFDRTRNRRATIKDMLMNSHVVVGVGNIYANEALFHAGMHPQREVGKINLDHCDELIQAVQQTLQLAIKAGGSSLRDFVHSDGKPGYFQQQYWVYGRGGQPCKSCDTVIQKIRQNQRSSFYCPNCQRSDEHIV